MGLVAVELDAVDAGVDEAAAVRPSLFLRLLSLETLSLNQ